MTATATTTHCPVCRGTEAGCYARNGDHVCGGLREPPRGWTLIRQRMDGMYVFRRGTEGEQTPEGVDSRLVVRRVSEIPQTAVEWLWQSRIEYGSLNLCGGDAGSKKSLLVCALAAAVTTGAAWPGELSGRPPADVLFLPAEDDLSKAVAPRLHAAGADLERVHIVEGAEIQGQSFMCMLPRDASRLGKLIEQTRARLCIIDPLKSYVDADTDSNRNERVRAEHLHPLVRIAVETNCAFVLVSHLNKCSTTQLSALYRLSGSLAYVEVCRTVSIVAPDKENTGRSYWVPVKINHAARPQALAFSVRTNDDNQPVVTWERDTVAINADDALAPRINRPACATDEAAEWLRSELDAGPVLAADILARAKDMKFSEAVVRSARNRIRALAVPKRDGIRIVGWEWSLSDGRQT